MCTMSKHSMSYKVKKLKRQDQHRLANKGVEAQRRREEASENRQQVTESTARNHENVHFASVASSTKQRN